MKPDERLQDWTFRYQYMYRLRRTNKQKRRFISALVADISQMRQDIKIIEHQQNKKYVSSNVYVGDVETADRIICTYYDTPPKSIGPYTLFDRKKQRQAVTSFMVISTVIALLFGLIVTLAYMKSSQGAFDFRSVNTLIAIGCYGIYFFLFSKVAKGLSTRKTLIRNTSSVLALLSLIETVTTKKTAFAFVDEGCFGELGLDLLKETCKASAKIYALDCVGAATELHVMGDGIQPDKRHLVQSHPQEKNQMTFIFGGRLAQTAQGPHFYLEPSDLKQSTLKVENIDKIKALFD